MFFLNFFPLLLLSVEIPADCRTNRSPGRTEGPNGRKDQAELDFKSAQRCCSDAVTGWRDGRMEGWRERDSSWKRQPQQSLKESPKVTDFYILSAKNLKIHMGKKVHFYEEMYLTLHPAGHHITNWL